MTEVGFSSSFKRAYKKRIAGQKRLERKFLECLDRFIANPYDPRLRTHKLSGKLNHLWSFTVEYDVRVVFIFLPKGRAQFEDIGAHDEVY
jgi:mRNA-degrading endonuclease YafQ of YafQ-DinJ toxin-antitoxin module